MSPVSLTLDLLLAALLLITLIFGLRLDRRLKTLNASQAAFQAAIADLDHSAARAEAGLADLRASMDEAAELLGGRLEKARDVAQRLERLTTQAAQAAAAPAERRSSLERAWSQLPEPESAAAPRGDVAPLTLTRREAVATIRAPSGQSAARSRAQVDDELFARPGLPRQVGARL